jgi:hypothetical protein
VAPVYDKENPDDDKPLKKGKDSGAAESDVAKQEKAYAAHSAAKRDARANDEQDKLDNVIGKGYKSEQDRKIVRGRIVTRKRAGILATIGFGTGLTFWAFATLQGPFQIIHFSQLLQGFHLKSNEEFSSTRMARNLRNIKTGQAQRSRLNTVSNKYADRVERRMNDRAGLRSAYDGTTGKFLGYEITDEAKARDHVRDFRLDGNAAKVNAPGFARGPNGEAVTGRFIDFTDADRLTR